MHKLISFFVVVDVWKLMCCRTILQIRESTLYFGNEALKKKSSPFTIAARILAVSETRKDDQRMKQ